MGIGLLGGHARLVRSLFLRFLFDKKNHKIDGQDVRKIHASVFYYKKIIKYFKKNYFENFKKTILKILKNIFLNYQKKKNFKFFRLIIEKLTNINIKISY